MKTYFYISTELPCETACLWHLCPHRYLASLRQLDTLDQIQTIDGNPALGSMPPQDIPRHGDIVIFFACSLDDLNRVTECLDYFESTRNILVLADTEGIDGDSCHRLGPRFITAANRNVGELEAVIQRMKSMTLRTESYRGVTS